jgi:hypothetical protein
MTANQIRLLALFDQMEAMGLRCGYVPYWKGSRQSIPADVALETLAVDEWEAEFEVLSVPDRLAEMHSFLLLNADAIELLEEAYDLKREAECDLCEQLADEGDT